MKGIGSAAMVRFTLFAVIVAVSPLVGSANDDVLARDDIVTTRAEIDRLVHEMDGAIAAAESSLAGVKSMDIEGGRALANELHDDLKSKVTAMLEGLAPNSVLMDNLEGAKANVIVLQRWFERQPPDYPNRDALIMRLDETTRSYGELSELIRSGRQDAQDALRELMRARFYQSMELMVENAEDSVDVMRNLVASLQNLSAKIRQVEEQEVPQAISN